MRRAWPLDDVGAMTASATSTARPDARPCVSDAALEETARRLEAFLLIQRRLLRSA